MWTLAGSGISSYMDGLSSAAAFSNPRGVSLDPATGGLVSIFVADAGNNRVRVVSRGGAVATYAGTGVSGTTSGALPFGSTFSTPTRWIFSNTSGAAYVVDSGASILRRSTCANQSMTPSPTPSLIPGASPSTTPTPSPVSTPTASPAPSGIAPAVLQTACTISVFVGNPNGLGSVNGIAAGASFQNPYGISLDSNDNLWVRGCAVVKTCFTHLQLAPPACCAACVVLPSSLPGILPSPSNLAPQISDVSNNRVRTATPSGVVTSLAGSPVNAAGYADGWGTNALFATGLGLSVLAGGATNPLGVGAVLFDCNNARIRLVLANGLVTTLAGTGVPGYADGAATASMFAINTGGGITSDTLGNVFAADTSNFRVRVVLFNATVITLCGLGVSGTLDGPPSIALIRPTGVVFDLVAGGRLFVADGSARIRAVSWPGGWVTTIAGTGSSSVPFLDGPALQANLNAPYYIAQEPNGNLLWTEPSWSRVRRYTIATGLVSTVVGTGMSGYTNGLLPGQLINQPHGLAVTANGTIYMSEGSAGSSFNGIRVMSCPVPVSSSTQSLSATPTQTPSATAGAVCAMTTLVGVGAVPGNLDGVGSGASFNTPTGMCSDGSGNLIVADRFNGRLRVVDPRTAAVWTLAGGLGGGTNGLFADGPQEAAGFQQPFSIAMDPSYSVVYCADFGGHRVRRVTYPGGLVSTHAGTGNSGSVDGLWNTAQLASPQGLCVAPSGTVIYVADTGNNKVRAIAGGYVTTVAGSTFSGSADGVGSNALFRAPSACVVAPGGSVIYVATYGSSAPYDSRIRVVTFATPSSVAVVTTLAGTLTPGYADGAAALSSFRQISSLVFDASGANLMSSDTFNHRLRVTSIVSGQTSTLAGGSTSTTTVGAWADGSSSTSRINTPRGLVVDPASGVVYLADSVNHVIRVLVCGATPSPSVQPLPSPTPVPSPSPALLCSATTIAGAALVCGYADGLGLAATFNTPSAIAYDPTLGRLVVADNSNRIRAIPLSSSPTYTIAGAGGSGSSAAFLDGAASVATFVNPLGIAVDTLGNIFVSDTYVWRGVHPYAPLSHPSSIP